MKKIKSKCHCINIRRAANRISKFYDNTLKAIGLSVNQYSLLINLSRLERSNITTLANYVDLERTTLVRTVKPLIEKQFIEDIAIEGKRDRELVLTEKGWEKVRQGEILWTKAQNEIENRIGKENIKLLYEILEKI